MSFFVQLIYFPFLFSHFISALNIRYYSVFFFLSKKKKRKEN